MRRSALECTHTLESCGASQSKATLRLGVARTTLREWTELDLSGRAPRPRGRRPQYAARAERAEILSVLDAEGTGIGIPELERRFPGVARRELEELRARRAYVLRRRGGSGLRSLEWTSPGSVWAGDFTNTPCWVDGELGKLSLVRDLGSQRQLLSMPSSGESAAEVALGLEQLFAEHSPPLVLKEDNGPGYVAERTRELCAAHGVLILYSPPYTPSYNGSCEAGGGSMKNRAARFAAARGRPDAWTSDDVEAARLQANACVRVGGPRGPTPDDLWAARPPVGDAARIRFLSTYRRQEAHARVKLGFEEIVPLPRAVQAMIDRRAVPKALVELGYLEIRRR